ncbi:2OG-Fe(II) oxygenase [Neptunicella sp. SCSIO 80796]|uniref:2OG-Fe(II) oxygenase n=1 Tax=Neptunicella plasticusilytica TaxID=3117012 RepID=UPI003A4E666C
MSNKTNKWARTFDQLNWSNISETLLQQGYIVIDKVFDRQQCDDWKDRYAQAELFRKTVTMQRYQFGSGEYKYFSYPLPDDIQQLRQILYKKLACAANTWATRLNKNISWPEALEDFIQFNRHKQQTLATPLMLNYAANDYNCLHQDNYGEAFFPFQCMILLSDPVTEFSGGEFVLVENRPRQQSIAKVVSIQQGQMVIFCNNQGIRQTTKGFSKTSFRHGVSNIRSGNRKALSIIFHDAQS